MENKISVEIEVDKNGRSTTPKIPHICPTCQGSGEVIDRDPVKGESIQECKTCNGSGKVFIHLLIEIIAMA